VDISQPDCIEVMPGCMPKVISWVVESIHLPVIAGGLVCDQEDAEAALKAGAMAVSSTNPIVWALPVAAGVAPAEKKPPRDIKISNILLDAQRNP
jgi:hypothetical protein